MAVKDIKKVLPKDFIWGFATAAYQVEGGYHDDGRADSIWDIHCRIPGNIADGSSGSIACDSYHRIKEDVELLKSYGATAYRFSISWSRVIPLGGRNDPVNEEGLAYYVRLTDSLLAANIQPVVTLYHWDLPATLDDRYGGLLGGYEFVQDFVHYARVMFDTLAEKVHYWITFNEPWCSTVLGYSTGLHAPGHTSDRTKSPVGDGTTEPWIASHNILLAHAYAVKAFREDFKAKNGGEIAITLNGDWVEPWDPQDLEDIEACTRKLEFFVGWFADPIYFGRYPKSMIKQLGARLPKFTDEEAAVVKGSNDYYGMNHYTTNYIKHKKGPAKSIDFSGNLEVLMTNKNGDIIGPETQSFWLRPYPVGFRKMFNWLDDRYGHPKFLVTENGTSILGENNLPVESILQDEFRVWYFREYISQMVDAKCKDGINIVGYMAWSLMDNFEWAEGFECRFGVTYVDYANGQIRYPKKSARVIGQIFRDLIERDQ